MSLLLCFSVDSNFNIAKISNSDVSASVVAVPMSQKLRFQTAFFTLVSHLVVVFLMWSFTAHSLKL